ncbi:hypothetical protein TNIN_291791 [Trichonephila inaurata madagascariensis]|uniref:Uncharacterized protein n=1 Tax=Trichonephila inaurata madagascariensis TaxID=2747483 RepID=A0A8X6XZW7_9ARAC|nr:hypothetical protein TNIN_291791 [Trichonephila inaurata madagascariensis]
MRTKEVENLILLSSVRETDVYRKVEEKPEVSTFYNSITAGVDTADEEYSTFSEDQVDTMNFLDRFTVHFRPFGAASLGLFPKDNNILPRLGSLRQVLSPSSGDWR